MTNVPNGPHSDERAFTITRTFDAPRALVFTLFTDPEYVAQWWGIEGSTCTVCELDVRPGGLWRIDMRAPDGTVYPNGGVYVDVVENERIVSTDVPDPASPAWGGDPPGDAVHTIDFAERDGKTTVTFNARFSTVTDRDRLLKSGMREGIGQGFDRLGRLIAARQHLRRRSQKKETSMAIASLTPAVAGAGRVVSADGTRIAFERSGDGDPIVLVDGAFCSRTFGPMATLAPLLAKDFTVFAYDRRGRGESGDTKPYAVDREIEDLQAVIDAAGGSAHVFGMSSGAILALDAAACGLSIRKLALYEPPFVSDPSRFGEQSEVGGRDMPAGHNRLFDGSSRHIGSGQAPPADATEQLTAMIAADRRGDAVAFFMKLMGMPSFVLAIMRFLPLWSKLKAVAHTLPYDAAIVGEGSLPAQAASVDVPTIVIGGEKSPARLRNAVRAVAHTMPNARQLFLEGQDHNVSSKVLAPALEQFFRR